MLGPNTRSPVVQEGVELGPYRLNVTVPLGTVVPLDCATVTASVTGVPAGPPALADVVVVLPVGGGDGGGVIITDSPGAPQGLIDEPNPDPAAGV